MKRKATGKKKSSPNTPADQARIRAGIMADQDAGALTAEELPRMRPLRDVVGERCRRRPRVMKDKIPVVIRLEPYIVKFFRSAGADWQVRMNAALSEYVRRHRPRR